MYNRQSNIYRKVSADSAPPTRILAELYNALIADVRGAADSIAIKDFAAKGNRVGRALSIIAELESALDRAAAPELTDSLSRLYDFARERLMRASAHMEIEPLVEAEKILVPIRDAFEQATRTAA